jgi:uncharacterized protein YbjT (DUF2867 family)
MFAVVGATGNTGRVVVEELLAAGHAVRAIGRSEERLGPLTEHGAEPFVADVSDPEAVASACDGVGGIYCMIPPRFDVDIRGWQTEVGTALATGIGAAGVPYVVNLSSVGAQHHRGTGPIAGLREHEDRLNELTEANVLHLRPAYFMENHFMALEGIRAMGVLGTPLREDLALPMIATRDIGQVAARRLAALDFEGHHTQELLGPRDYTMPEVAGIIGVALSMPDLAYTRIPDEAVEGAMTGMGIHPSTIATFLEMHRGINDGLVVAVETRSRANTTPTTLEDLGPAFTAAFGT